jgi:hypothetical protein
MIQLHECRAFKAFFLKGLCGLPRVSAAFLNGIQFPHIFVFAGRAAPFPQPHIPLPIGISSKYQKLMLKRRLSKFINHIYNEVRVAEAAETLMLMDGQTPK